MPKPYAGFSLIELSIASFILGVGSLAVMHLTLHWHASLEQLTARMQELDHQVELRPEPSIARRYEFLICERDK